MNHSDALKSGAAEKYLLGELTAEERAAYEEHYFDCPECAEDVKAGAILLDNARQVLRTEFSRHPAPAVEEQRSWFSWFRPAYALAAIAVLVAALAFQNLVTIPRLRDAAAIHAPVVLPSFSFVTLGSRSDAGLTVTADPDRPFGLYVDIPASNRFGSYTCRIRSASGASAFAVQVSAAQARDTVQLLVPGSTLKPGNYVLVIEGKISAPGPESAGQEIVRYPFVVQAQK